MTPTTTPIPILHLHSLANEIRERAERAFDVDDRYSGETDEMLCAEIGLLVHLADKDVWSGSSDIEDQNAIEQFRFTCQNGSEAWTYLRSGAPAVQRTLKQPSADDAAFIAERYGVEHRRNASWCSIELGDCQRSHSILERLCIPGMRGRVWLKHVIHRCTNFTQARRVLNAIGLEHKTKKEGDTEYIVVLGESITRYTPPS